MFACWMEHLKEHLTCNYEIHLLHFSLSDIYLKSIVGIADSLYNLRLIRTFCDKYIPNKTCHFTYEDMLYTKEPLKENFLVMVAELFYWFEIKPLSVVTGGVRVSLPASGEGDGKLFCFNLRLNSCHWFCEERRIDKLEIWQL